jgi:branched-chain amino acid transport system substrate-binding protein
MNQLKLIASVLALSASLSMPAFAEIRIGVILSLTGPGASLGMPEADTVKLWPKKIGNEDVVVTVLNDNSDPTAAATAARKLVTENKVDVLVGSSVTPPSIAIVEVAAENRIALVSLAGGGAIVEPQEGSRKWAFKVSPSETFSSSVIVDHMTRTGVKSVAVIGLSNAYGDGFVKSFEKTAEAHGLKIVASERYGTADPSVVGQVVKILAAKPDAIYIAASGTPGALPQIELANRGWKGATYQTQGVANNDWLRVGGKAVEGTFMTTAPVLVAEQLADTNPTKKPGVAYVTAFEGAYGPNSRSLFGASAWDVFLMLEKVAQGIPASIKPQTPEYRVAIRDGVEHLKDFVTAEGVYTMSERDHNGVDARCQVLVKVIDGRWKLVP